MASITMMFKDHSQTLLSVLITMTSASLETLVPKDRRKNDPSSVHSDPTELDFESACHWLFSSSFLLLNLQAGKKNNFSIAWETDPNS